MTSQKEEVLPQDRLRGYKTFVFSCCFMAAGMSTAIVGPTLLDLSLQVNSSVDQTSLSLTARSIGLAVGALVSGIIHPKLDFLLTTAFASLIAGICTLIIGNIVSLEVLLMAFFANGLSLGLIEGGSTVFLLHLWRKQAMPYIQISYFMYVFGGFLTPLICEPFLLVVKESADDEPHPHVEHKTWLFIPFSILSLILFVNTVLAFFAWYFDPVVKTMEKTVDLPVVIACPDDLEAKQVIELPDTTNHWKTVVVILHLLLIHAQYGVTIMMESFLVTYVVQSPGLMLSKGTGSQITSLYWSMMAIGKLFAIPIIPRLGTRNSLYLGLFVLMTGSFLLSPIVPRNEAVIWSAAALMGLGASSMFALMLRFLEKYMEVTHAIGSLTSVSGVMGEFTFPVIISFLIDSCLDIVPWVAFGSGVAQIFIFAVIVVVSRLKLRNTTS